MNEQLDTIMGALHSDEAQLAFLRSIYAPGNTEVADRILAMSEDYSIIEKEITHARESGDTDRFRSMAKRHIDYYVTHDFDILLRDIVKGWNDPELADYAIVQMTSKPEDDRKLEGPLQYSAEIAQAFGKEDVAQANLERLLALQERDSEYKFPSAQTLKKLGRFDEAIDRYLEAEWTSAAFNLAKEKSPGRLTAIAEIGFNEYKPGSGSAEFYVECATQIGKTAQAEKTLVEYAKKVKVDSSPRFYGGVVTALVSLGQEGVARKLVERVAKNEEQVKASDRYYEFDRSEEMAKLYHAIGETDAVRNIYAERIDTRIRERHHPSNALNDIKKAIEFTGDQSFREKELDIFERQREYQKAASLATELGKPELAQVYTTMHDMMPKQESK
ncbi:hypothetical protein AYK26_04795 [Euryarchaeota archaeon SM23-78]|nr:MAG: hypothetical protein AYK26_04795 [Euryarchaeota archaeon SM23-78]MBW3000757.1 hypothetical protein [Candidatus Woesearchaeota archaeon]